MSMERFRLYGEAFQPRSPLLTLVMSSFHRKSHGCKFMYCLSQENLFLLLLDSFICSLFVLKVEICVH